MANESDILERERQFWVRSGEFYEQWLARDAIMIFPAPAGIMHRDDAIAGLRTSARWVSVEMSAVSVRQLGDSAIVLAYRAKARKADAASDYEAHIGSVYVRESDAWKLAFHQHTPLPRQPDA